jgi:8-oxo-dGTP diphosphatase
MRNKPFGLAVKAVVRDRSGRCLLIRRAPGSRNSPGTWDLPGGKVDKGEDFVQALEREVAEETGLRISVQRLAGAIQFEMPKARVVCLMLEARARPGRVRLSCEHDESAWVRVSELTRRVLFRPFRSFVREWAAGECGRNWTRGR